jgi:hypothetical protein
MFFGAQENFPQRLKPTSFLDFGGTAKAVPFPRPIFETRLTE